MIEAPYGFCPICFAPGKERTRARTLEESVDKCQRGHEYPTNSAIPSEQYQTEELRLKNEIIRAEITLDDLKEKLLKVRMILEGVM